MEDVPTESKKERKRDMQAELTKWEVTRVVVKLEMYDPDVTTHLLPHPVHHSDVCYYNVVRKINMSTFACSLHSSISPSISLCCIFASDVIFTCYSINFKMYATLLEWLWE